MKRGTSKDSAARFLAMRQGVPERCVRPSQRQLTATPEALAARRATGHLNGKLTQRAFGSIAEALGALPQPTDRIVVDFGRGTLEEIHLRLCEVIVDGKDTLITRIAEDMVRSALEHRSKR